MERLRSIISVHRLWCPLPAPTDALFAAHRQEVFVRMVLVGWPLLILMLAMITLSGPLLFADELVGNREPIWWPSVIAESVIIGLTIVLLYLPLFQKRYQAVIIVGGALALAIPLLGSLVMDSPRLMQALSYVSMLIITLLGFFNYPPRCHRCILVARKQYLIHNKYSRH